MFFLQRFMSTESVVPIRVQIPDDIERLIFEKAVEDDPDAAVNIIKVARRTRLWIEPLLYRVVVLNTDKKGRLFLRTVTSSSKPASFFAKYVKKLYFRWIANAVASQISCACLSLESLCCDVITDPCRLSTTDVRPKRLSVNLCKFLGTPEPDFAHPFFSRLTHLQHVGSFREWGAWAWTGAEHLTRLTHLALRVYPHEPRDGVCAMLSALVRRLPALRVCVLLVCSEVASVHALAAGHSDARIVVGDLTGLPPGSPYAGEVISRPYPHNIRDWGHLLPDERDTWELAEDVVRRRMLKVQSPRRPAIKDLSCGLKGKPVAQIAGI